MFSDLSVGEREFVVRGIYSLFELQEPRYGYNYVMIKSNNSAILLNYKGSKSKSILDIDGLKLGKMLTIAGVAIPDSVKVDNIL